MSDLVCFYENGRTAVEGDEVCLAPGANHPFLEHSADHIDIGKVFRIDVGNRIGIDVDGVRWSVVASDWLVGGDS